ncbi:MAG: hypothetical protein A2Z21_01865 [Candidatus Fraserbacteria bacterium RBG_16_55_9]|uniref:Uncharacterized protein n=1 Tax=Fraserbacteria sp. (strain RBG_16_55_9) TaxID=1817864 RepID=A0A1F5UP82_FRAXR|nr:MAG: hypothetical protein A2Z21_01865 [Candidatus Fraserbacteria bacterium RBG_16_55_9]
MAVTWSEALDLDAAREVFRVEPMAGEVHMLGNWLADEIERHRSRIAALEAALREAREAIVQQRFAGVVPRLDAVLAKSVGGGS